MADQDPVALVHKLTAFAYKVLQVDLAEFFTQHALDFDQDVGDFKAGVGETVQQHEVFMEYERLFEERLDTFWKDTGFQSAEECFEVVKKGAEDARIHEVAALEELHRKMAEEEAAQAQAGGEEGARVAPGPGMHAPLPIPLESMLAQVGNLGEYTTFSIMIRARAAQMRLEKETKEAISEGGGAGPTERMQGGETPLAVFLDLRNRICNLTPNRSDIREHVEKMLDGSVFESGISEGENWRSLLGEQLRFSCFHIDYLSSPEHQKVVYEFFEENRPLLEADMSGETYKTTYLDFLHRSVNRIQKDLAAAFEMRKKAAEQPPQ